MTTSGVEKLHAYEKSRSDEAQQDSRKFDSQGNKAEDSEFESIETIGDIIASPDDPTDDDENVARDQQNVVACAQNQETLGRPSLIYFSVDTVPIQEAINVYETEQNY